MLMVMVSTRCPSGKDEPVPVLSSMVYLFSMSCCCICVLPLGPIYRPLLPTLPLLPLAFFCSWLLVVTDFTTALVEFTAFRCAQGLAPNTRVGIIGYLAAPVRFRQIKAGEWVVLPQRVSRPIHGHQDAAQIRMACKSNAKEVVYLAFIPVRCWP